MGAFSKFFLLSGLGVSLVSCQSFRDTLEVSILAHDMTQVEADLAHMEAEEITLSEEEKSEILYAACKTNNPEMVRLICRKLRPQVSVDCVTYGIFEPSKPILDILFDYDKAKTQEFATTRFSALRNEDMAAYLMSQGCSPILDLPSTNDMGVFKLCVRTIGLKNIPQKDMSLILLFTMRRNNDEKLRFLLEEGLDVNAPYNDKTTIREFILSSMPHGYKCVFLFEAWEKQ